MTDAPYSRQTQATPIGEFNRTAFLIRQLMNRANIATLVRVESCTNDGGLTEAGTVDVTPLVNQLDALGRPVPHGTVHGLLYLRLQGGVNAVIMDPQPGDIGVCVFSDRDLSAVKAALAPANPGSGRRNDYADGMYLGGWGNQVPSQYFRLSDAGVEVVSPAMVTVRAPLIELVADETVTIQAPVIVLEGEVQVSGEVVGLYGSGDSVSLTGHTHQQAHDSHGDAEVPTDPPTRGT